MKISNSKKELARIISENGGWRDGAESAAQCIGGEISFWHDTATKQRGEDWCGRYLGASDDIKFAGVKLPNWHQTILSREEYFHLCQAPDADGWTEWKGGAANPVEFGVLVDVKLANGEVLNRVSANSGAEWRHCWGDTNIIAYRLHKPEQAKPELCESVVRSIPEPDEQVWTNPPSIEQMAADYHNAKDYADRKQQEADDAKADEDEALRKLELAGEALGLLVSPTTEKQEQELVITDWRDLQAGDVISVSGKWWVPDSEYTVDKNDGSRDAPIRVGGYWAFIGECSFKFIRRP